MPLVEIGVDDPNAEDVRELGDPPHARAEQLVGEREALAGPAVGRCARETRTIGGGPLGLVEAIQIRREHFAAAPLELECPEAVERANVERAAAASQRAANARRRAQAALERA